MLVLVLVGFTVGNGGGGGALFACASVSVLTAVKDSRERVAQREKERRPVVVDTRECVGFAFSTELLYELMEVWFCATQGFLEISAQNANVFVGWFCFAEEGLSAKAEGVIVASGIC